MKIRIGTRGSKLALWQAYYVQQKLNDHKIDTEIVIIDTKGDKILDVTLSKIGSKGLFTEELEAKLFSEEIDIAVHSAKDVQSHLPAGLEIIAFSEREDVNDVLVSFNKNASLSDTLKPITVGTSSTRRVATLKHQYPHVKIVDMRGNLQTRFEKMKKGDCDAMILAYAGVHRMEFDEYIVTKLPLEQFTPPVGQGSVAIECATQLDDMKKTAIRKAINHTKTETCLKVEREFLYTMNGGCSVPTFAYCRWLNSSQLTLKGGIISLDGKDVITQFMTINSKEAPHSGEKLAIEVLSKGGDVILEEIKRKLKS